MRQKPNSPPPTRHPKIAWNDGEFVVTLPLPDNQEMRASWRPTTTSVIRVREVGTKEWSVGFETPLNSCNIIGLDPDREYETELRYKNKDGEGPPARTVVPRAATDFTLLPKKSV